jgi:hypothetical protein
MNGFIRKESNLKIEDAIYDETLLAGDGWMYELKKDRHSELLTLVVIKQWIQLFMIYPTLRIIMGQ